MSNSYDSGAPKHLIAFDGSVLDHLPESARRQVSGQFSSPRHRVLIVEFRNGRSDESQLDRSDYLVSKDAKTIIRLSDGVELDHWSKSGGHDQAGALTYLADELMIPHSQIFFFTRSIPGSLVDSGAHLYVLDGDGVAADSDESPPNVSTGSAIDLPELLGHVLSSIGPGGRRSTVAEEAFERALDTLHRNVTDLGFTAASLTDNELMEHDSNYAAVWARDGVITGLWTLCVDDQQLHDCFKTTLQLMAKHQAASGQIPSYVRIKDESADYSGIGGIASIDSVLWFVIGTIRYAFHKEDRAFSFEMAPHLRQAMQWLRAHDSNNDGLLELPESSDWMDLFPRSYNVLYDEVLWYQACRDYAVFVSGLEDGDAASWERLADQARSRILELFWPSGLQLTELAGSSSGRFSLGEARYMLSQVTPFDYSWRCDVLANLLASLTGLLSPSKRERLFTFLWGVGTNSPSPVACLYPPIQSGSEDWKDYFMVNFLNLPHHYHNGGVWPFIGGLWVRFLYESGREELAHRELSSLAESCRMGIQEEWEFNEWLHGITGRPMGKAHQAWSAASYVKAYLAVKDRTEPAAFEPLKSPVFLRKED